MRGDISKSATDLLIEAMERAEEMHEVIVVYRLKDSNGEDSDGFCWLSNVPDTLLRIGMVTASAKGMFDKAYREPE